MPVSPPAALALALAALCLTTAPVDVFAKPEFVARIPNGANVPGVEAIGHTNAAGDGPRNQFGKDFDAAGRKWTTELCKKDSDGDGQTNGQELGDPCCAFVVGSNAKVLWTTGVSHPGDKSKTSDASLWASVSCSASGATSAPSANATSGGNATMSGTDDSSDAAAATVTTPAPTKQSAAPRNAAVQSAAALVTSAVLALAFA